MTRRRRDQETATRRKRRVRRDRPPAGWPPARGGAISKGSAAGARVVRLTAARRRKAARRRVRVEDAAAPAPAPGGDAAIDFHLATCVAAARAGGRVLTEFWGRRGGYVIQEKGRNDFVTAADRESEEVILRLVRARFPDHAILAEESSPREGTAGYRWYIDPLDGTTNFIHGYPFFCVSVGLADAQGMCAAAVFDPLRDEMFTAVRGRGAFLNQQPIRVSAAQKLSHGLVVTGIPFRSLHRLDEYLASFRAFILASSAIRRDGSAALDLAYVASGRYEGFWEMALSPWDVAAGSLIVSEAGGTVTDFQGQWGYLDSGDIIAANPNVHPAMLRIVREAYRTA
jgi:myo-inositol-1(or 4)-monophosphatase